MPPAGARARPYHSRSMTSGRKLAWTALLFAVAVGLVILTAVTHRVWPLFVAWIPLVTAAWVLGRREPGYVPPPLARPAPDPGGEHGAPPREDDPDAAAGAVTDAGSSTEH